MQLYTCHGTYNRTKRPALSDIRYIVDHYTGGTGSAKNNCLYFGSGNRNASADYFIDKDGTIWEYNNPAEGYYTWHCGDGRGAYGITNRNSIGIEYVSNGEDFTEAQIKAGAELHAYLRGIYGSHLITARHYDASRKYCPSPYIDAAKWRELKSALDGGAVSKPTASASAAAANKPSSTYVAPAAKKGKVAEFQQWLIEAYGKKLTVDNAYGAKTKAAAIEALQTELNRQFGAGLKVDGKWGPKTKAACVSVRNGANGNITRILQGLLYAKGYDTNGLDGKFGDGTEKAVRAFQAAKGLSVDGVAGKNTFAALLG